MSREHPSEPRLCPDGRRRKQFNWCLDVEVVAALKEVAMRLRPRANPAAHVEVALMEYVARHTVPDAPRLPGNNGAREGQESV